MKKLSYLKLASLMLLGGMALSSQAAEIGADLTNDKGEAVAGSTVYSLSKEGDYYTFTPTTTGDITVQTNYTGNVSALMYQPTGVSYFFFYAYEDIFIQESVGAYTLVEDEGWSFVFNVKANTEYVFGYNDLLGSPIDFTITLGNENEVPATLTYVYPTAGTYFDQAININDFTLEFDQSLKSVGSVYLSYTDTNGQAQKATVPAGPEGYVIESQILIIRIANVNNIFYNMKKQADTSSPFYLVIEDCQGGGGPVTSAKLNQGQDAVTVTGNNISIEYNFVDNVRLVSAQFPSTFYASWPEDYDGGTATLTFDGPVKPKATVSVVLGEHYFGDTGGGDDEDPDPSFEPKYSFNSDNTVMTIDFKGIDYGAAAFKPYSYVTVMVYSIFGEDGTQVIMSGGTDENPTIVPNLSKIIPFVNSSAGVESLLADPSANGAIYDLQGRKVNNPTKGLYIVNGKKVVVK